MLSRKRMTFKIPERKATIPGLEVIRAGEGTIRAGERTASRGQDF